MHSKPARPRWGARIGRSSPLGFAGALDRTEPNENEPNQTGQAYSETLRRAGPRMPVALNTETNILRAWNARVRTSINIYIYIYICMYIILLIHMYLIDPRVRLAD